MAKMRKLDEQWIAFFHSVLPLDPRISVKPMFGSLAGFINGNMFTGLFDQTIFIRLPEAKRTELLEQGAIEFSPMPGRAMKEYIGVPAEWWQTPGRISGWIADSLSWAETLPEKMPAKKKSKA